MPLQVPERLRSNGPLEDCIVSCAMWTVTCYMIYIIPFVILTEIVFCGVWRLSHCKDRYQERDFPWPWTNKSGKVSTVSEREKKYPMVANTIFVKSSREERRRILRSRCSRPILTSKLARYGVTINLSPLKLHKYQGTFKNLKTKGCYENAEGIWGRDEDCGERRSRI